MGNPINEGTIMIDKSKTYTTREGLPVRIYCTDAGGSHPVHGAIEAHGLWLPFLWREDGDNCEHALIEVKPKRTLDVTVNVYQSIDDTLYSGTGHPSRKDADLSQSGKRFACIHIVREITEGEGL